MKVILKLLVMLYQKIISPLTLPSCRYSPTCSEYALEAIKKKKSHIALKLIIKRLLKCHPWGGNGYDPVP